MAAQDQAGTTPSVYLIDPDVQLMLKVKGGDDAAFAELMRNYQDRLVGILFHLVHDRTQAEDLAQEVFLRVFRSRESYIPAARFSTWVFRIANNLASNSRRNQGRRREISLAGSESGPLGARPQENLVMEKSAFMPARQLAKEELRTVVRAALETLNERQRMAVLLHKFEDMSYEDIAESMELTVSAVKSLLSRARESLRTVLDAYAKK